jgi:hypothetical protein
MHMKNDRIRPFICHNQYIPEGTAVTCCEQFEGKGDNALCAV